MFSSPPRPPPRGIPIPNLFLFLFFIFSRHYFVDYQEEAVTGAKYCTRECVSLKQPQGENGVRLPHARQLQQRANGNQEGVSGNAGGALELLGRYYR